MKDRALTVQEAEAMHAAKDEAKAKAYKLTPVPGAEPSYDEEGREIVDVATCGTCGRSWNDAQSSSITPAPSGRCPFEYEHSESRGPATYRVGEIRGLSYDAAREVARALNERMEKEGEA